MKRLSCIGAALACAVCIAGCASPGPSAAPAAVVTPMRTKAIPADRARDFIAIGKSTRADVAAALGETQIIRFESGFEVWVYRIAAERPAKAAAAQGSAHSGREAGDASAGEFVVLFTPSGVVAKTRTRPSGGAETPPPG